MKQEGSGLREIGQAQKDNSHPLSQGESKKADSSRWRTEGSCGVGGSTGSWETLVKGHKCQNRGVSSGDLLTTW